MSKSAYPQKFIDKCIQNFLNNMFIQRLQIPTVPKKQLIIILPYLGKISQIVKARLTKTMNKHMKFCKLRVIFQRNNKLQNHLRFKDPVPETWQSNLIYKFLCRSCTASEHQGVFPRTCKPVEGTLPTSVRDHMLICDHKIVHK